MNLSCEDLDKRERTAHKRDLAYRIDDQNSLPIGPLDATEPISTGRL